MGVIIKHTGEKMGIEQKEELLRVCLGFWREETLDLILPLSAILRQK